MIVEYFFENDSELFFIDDCVAEVLSPPQFIKAEPLMLELRMMLELSPPVSAAAASFSANKMAGESWWSFARISSSVVLITGVAGVSVAGCAPAAGLSLAAGWYALNDEAGGKDISVLTVSPALAGSLSGIGLPEGSQFKSSGLYIMALPP